MKFENVEKIKNAIIQNAKEIMPYKPMGTPIEMFNKVREVLTKIPESEIKEAYVENNNIIGHYKIGENKNIDNPEKYASFINVNISVGKLETTIVFSNDKDFLSIQFNTDKTKDDVDIKEHNFSKAVNNFIETNSESFNELNEKGIEVFKDKIKEQFNDISFNAFKENKIDSSFDRLNQILKSKLNDIDKFKEIVEKAFGNPFDKAIEESKKEPIITLEDGTVLGVEYKDDKLYAGFITNTGLQHNYEIDYDKDLSVDENLQNLYDKIIESNDFESNTENDFDDCE